jgi:hypothetical protein
VTDETELEVWINVRRGGIVLLCHDRGSRCRDCFSATWERHCDNNRDADQYHGGHDLDSPPRHPWPSAHGNDFFTSDSGDGRSAGDRSWADTVVARILAQNSNR